MSVLVILFTIILLRSSLVSSKIDTSMSCEPQGNIRIVNKYDKVFNIYGVKIEAKFNHDEDILVKNDPEYFYFNPTTQGIDYNYSKLPVQVDFSIDDVTFKGFVRPADIVIEEKTFAEYSTYVSVTAQYRKNTDILILNGEPTNLHYNKRRCSVGFLRQNNEVQRKYFNDDAVEDFVLELIESCILSHVCDNIDRDDNYLKFKDHYNKTLTAINEIADNVAPSLIQHFIKNNTRLPDISGEYSFIVNAKFQGVNVSIINTPDIERASDIKLTQNGYKYAIEGDFRLHRLNIHFDDFKVTVPSTTSTGATDVYINRVTVFIKVEMDYTDSQCTASLKELDIYDYGTITINRPNSNETSWFPLFGWTFSMKNTTSSYVDTIVIAKARNITMKILSDTLINIDCNDFSYFVPSPDLIKTFWDTMMKVVHS